MFTRSTALVVFLLPALARADGTVVGHPVNLHFAAGNGLTFTSGSIAVTDQVVEFCDSSTLTLAIDDRLAIGDAVLLPTGTICGIDFHLNGATLLEGTGNAGGSFDLTLQMAVIQIEVDPPLVVSETGTSGAEAVELAEPGWVTAALLELGTGIHRSISSTHALHDPLKADVRNRSTVVQ